MNIEQKALVFATINHNGQYRNGEEKIEYINHPINVSFYLKQYFDYDENMVAAALLHDTLEDTDTSYQELRNNFNLEVANLVKELTSNKEKIKFMGKSYYLSKKMTHMSSKALDIKLCDRYDNINGCFFMDDKFKKKYVNETLYIIDYLSSNRILTVEQEKMIDKILVTINLLNTKKLVLAPQN